MRRAGAHNCVGRYARYIENLHRCVSSLAHQLIRLSEVNTHGARAFVSMLARGIIAINRLRWLCGFAYGRRARLPGANARLTIIYEIRISMRAELK